MTKWFLPETPDVIAALRAQSTITLEGMDAFARWAGGDPAQADAVRDAEHRADRQKRELRRMLQTAFMTPMEPEDLYALSERLDSVLNQAKDTVREAEVMETPPDPAIADMAALLRDGVAHLDDAFSHLSSADGPATDAADAAVHRARALEKVYRRAMSALLADADAREQMSRRELYRRCSRIADAVEQVAERVWYAVVKER